MSMEPYAEAVESGIQKIKAINMYKAYLFNDEGRYQAPIYLEDEDIMPFVFRYKNIVLKIMITKDDLSVLEVEQGKIIFPEFEKTILEQLENQSTKFPEDVTLESLLESYQYYVSIFVETKGRDKDVFQSMVTVENDLLALAARDKVNLYRYGWKNSGVIEAELEAANELN